MILKKFFNFFKVILTIYYIYNNKNTIILNNYKLNIMNKNLK